MKTDISQISTRENIVIKGAKLHNLKNIDLAIPRNKLVVITGLSGSGKSTLAFDTLYAEGQRRYVESLSSYARQFLGKRGKPKVDYIKGIPPAIAIEQKVNSTNPRSTVGTSTEIYDYLKLLFARIGKTYSPISGKEVKKHTVTDVINFVRKVENNTKLLLLSPIVIDKKRPLKKVLSVLEQQGYARLKYQGEIFKIGDFSVKNLKKDSLFLVIDRIITKDDEDFYNRLADSVQTAFFEGKGICHIENIDNKTTTHFSNSFELDGRTFLEPSTHLFSFNNPYGACPTCEGYGLTVGIDQNLVIPNTGLSIYQDAIVPYKSNSFRKHKQDLINGAYKLDISIHRPWFELTERHKQMIWEGTEYFRGINQFFEVLRQNYGIKNTVLLSRYTGKTICPDCRGTRLRKEANYVKVNQKTISDLVTLPIVELIPFFDQISLNEYEKKVAKRLLVEIKNRLQFLSDVGLEYLNMNRSSATLSGGESQRINLATSLGSSLVGSMYVLDEPSIGLHPKDTEKLIKILKNLRNLGNTVIVVEHDEDIMKASDYIIDIGPKAGTHGGEVVAKGTFKQILKSKTLTAQYLNGKSKIEVPTHRRKSNNFIKIIGIRENNLKNIDVSFPLNNLTVITGVSGSGKSTLVKKILFPAIKIEIGGYGVQAGQYTRLEGSFDKIKHVEFIDQNPIGKSSRSNPVTYIKIYDSIRILFSSQKLSKIRNYRPGHFSFNIDGGRCDVCKGEGRVTIEMQFMADVNLQCEACEGKRFKKEILEITYHKKTINDILNLTVDQAVSFFGQHKQTAIVKRLKPLQEVGLGYVALGQSSDTFSGGEAQRIKLASFLSKGNTAQKTLFIFDEPTTGLHFHDIKKLIASFDALVERGHSIVVIEHNLELIKCADYIIDLGLEGGKKGGNIVFEGTVEKLIKNKKSYTAKYLKDKIKSV